MYLVGFRTFLTPVSSSELSVSLWQIRNRWKNEYICSLCTYKPLNLVAFSSWSNCSSESYIASKCVIMVITHVCDVICLKKLQLINSAVYMICKDPSCSSCKTSLLWQRHHNILHFLTFQQSAKGRFWARWRNWSSSFPPHHLILQEQSWTHLLFLSDVQDFSWILGYPCKLVHKKPLHHTCLWWINTKNPNQIKPQIKLCDDPAFRALPNTH